MILQLAGFSCSFCAFRGTFLENVERHRVCIVGAKHILAVIINIVCSVQMSVLSAEFEKLVTYFDELTLLPGELGAFSD